jgi:hypothetical protein
MQIIDHMFSIAESQASKTFPSKLSECSRRIGYDSGRKIRDEIVSIEVNNKLDLCRVYENV